MHSHATVATLHLMPFVAYSQSIPILFSLCTRTFSCRLGVAISLFSGVSLAFGTSFVCFPLDSTSTLLRTTATRRRTTAPICPVGPLTWNESNLILDALMFESSIVNSWKVTQGNMCLKHTLRRPSAAEVAISWWHSSVCAIRGRVCNCIA